MDQVMPQDHRRGNTISFKKWLKHLYEGETPKRGVLSLSKKPKGAKVLLLLRK
jgi:hypothetical protein